MKLFGPNITNLPCGFVYPFYGRCECDPDQEGLCACDATTLDAATSCIAALTIYCDVNNAQFWSSLQLLGHTFTSVLQEEQRHKMLSAASEPVVIEALRQLRKVFNRTDIPSPILTSYRSWYVWIQNI